MNILMSGYELFWLFFIYSFLGWLLETTTAAIKQKRFVNRGLVNLPLCVIYGVTAVLITIFCGELQGIWLFLGAFINATLSEWTAGHLLEKIYHERWWDYSDKRFHLDGYICLSASLIWGLLGFVMMKWGNELFLHLFRLIPHVPVAILIWALVILLALDITATLIIFNGRSKNTTQWKAFDNWFSKLSLHLSNRIYARIDARIQKAYPQVTQVPIPETKPNVFAYGCSFYKIVWLLVVGAFLGDIVETIYCRITAGVWMSRSSVVWGPFSIVWGLAIAVFTALLYRYRNKSDSFLFLTGTLLGGAYEYACSVFTELVFGKVFWDYSKIPFNLGGRINLLYCFFWGIAAVIWMKFLYPKVSALIEKIPVKSGKVITWCMIIFMTCNILVSCMALTRSTERADGIPATHTWQEIMDERFDDERMNRIYPNALSRN